MSMRRRGFKILDAVQMDPDRFPYQSYILSLLAFFPIERFRRVTLLCSLHFKPNFHYKIAKNH